MHPCLRSLQHTDKMEIQIFIHAHLYDYMPAYNSVMCYSSTLGKKKKQPDFKPANILAVCVGKVG